MTATTTPLDQRVHSAADLKADALRILANCGVPARPHWVNRTVCRYLQRVAHTGYPFGAWLVAQIQLTSEQRREAMRHPDVAYFLCYSDPTGETAVRNVMAGA